MLKPPLAIPAQRPAADGMLFAAAGACTAAARGRRFRQHDGPPPPAFSRSDAAMAIISDTASDAATSLGRRIRLERQR